MLDLTQGSVSEKLNVVGQTESLHLRSRALVNHRVLNLQDTHQTQMKTQWHESLVVQRGGGGGGVTWLLEIQMPLLAISSIRCVSKLVRDSSPAERKKTKEP